MDKKEIRKKAERLSGMVQEIQAQIEDERERFIARCSPFRKEIKRLEEEFLDECLVDSRGKTVRPGMIIENEQGQYKVLNRYQQYLCQYLGNPMVVLLKKGRKKRTDLIMWNELVTYTIIDDKEEK